MVDRCRRLVLAIACVVVSQQPFVAGAAATAGSVAAGLPSGMDLLYGAAVPVQPGGEPVVTVGLAVHQRQVRLRGSGPVTVDFYEAGVLKRARLPAGRWLQVRLGRAHAAARQHFVDLGGVAPRTPAHIAARTAALAGRGVGGIEVLEEGTVVGLAGHVLDNRDVRLTVPARDAAAARRAALALGRRLGLRAQARSRLRERPWGELRLSLDDGSPMGLATSYVRLGCAAGDRLEVEDVPFGQGYAWAGHKTRAYRGEIYVAVDPEGTLAVVNALGAEALLQGVVPAEIYASSPPAALAAQAVAARNILLAKLGRRHHDDPFQLCAEQHCQVYGGADGEDPRTNEAVRRSRGEALFLGRELVDAVYSASCGGHTEDNDVVWGDAPSAALRGRADLLPGADADAFGAGISAANLDAYLAHMPASYCARAAPQADKVRWRKTLSAAQLQALLQATPQATRLGRLRDVQVLQRGPGGRAASLRLVGEHGAWEVGRELAIRQLLGNLRSAAFTAQVQHDAAGMLRAVELRGSGWGHGVGMCQLGAIGRARAGQTQAQILAHYYGGAGVEALWGPP